MLARRYAKALLALSERQKNSAKVKEEMVDVGNLARQRQYFDFFTNGRISVDDKLEPLKSLLPLTKDFLRLVIKNRREQLLYLISKEYADMYNQKNLLIDVEVVSKEPLDDGQKIRVRTRLEKMTKKKATICYRIDKKMPGGFSIRYEDKLIDGTISGMLKGMLKEMEGS